MKKLGKLTTEGWQYCEYCKTQTLHTPKLGLVGLGKRLCTRCNYSNIFSVSNKLAEPRQKKQNELNNDNN